ncbi:PadR family transcriptional regulator [Sneathiella sp. P13V-1]|uniref:PadR family transcriptional regulator n=1 Tax=Sneathiella sp. P13V-1 TaxID=2697366 RepID=UPI00187B885D|nr:PadR family transcriptional regulator [Sneathiella sp. P13V-1]MBE7637425.1 PadR family transcriptional regulator [Sneathiella sp. P13V-1]
MNVRILCLGFLTFGDATGYEIKKAFQERLSLLYDAGYGSIYPSLNKLAEEGLVTLREEVQSKRPDKKIYSITDLGRKTFEDYILRMPGEDHFRSEALTTLMYAHLLPKDHLTKVLDSIVSNYQQKIHLLSEDCDRKQTPSEKFLCGFGVHVREAAIDYINRNRHMLESCPDERVSKIA